MALLEHLAHQVRRLCDAVEDLALYTVRTRLARCLLSPTNDDAPSVQYWTQGELAAHIGTVRDVVGRTLRTFSREGLIRRDHGRVVVTDPAGLRREALREQGAHDALPAQYAGPNIRGLWYSGHSTRATVRASAVSGTA